MDSHLSPLADKLRASLTLTDRSQQVVAPPRLPSPQRTPRLFLPCVTREGRSSGVAAVYGSYTGQAPHAPCGSQHPHGGEQIQCSCFCAIFCATQCGDSLHTVWESLTTICSLSFLSLSLSLSLSHTHTHTHTHTLTHALITVSLLIRHRRRRRSDGRAKAARPHHGEQPRRRYDHRPHASPPPLPPMPLALAALAVVMVESRGRSRPHRRGDPYDHHHPCVLATAAR
jgi:hypothetical protein